MNPNTEYRIRYTKYPLNQHFINNPVLNSFLGCHKKVAVYVGFYFLQWLAGIFSHHFVQSVARREDMLGRDSDVRCLALRAAQWLVNHNLRVRKDEALAFLSGRKKPCRTGCRHPDTHR